MDIRNIIGIETIHGFRTFELYEGDLTHPAASTDLIVVSAFAGDYAPLPGTVIGALKSQCDIDVSKLARHSEYDLRETFGFWISGLLTDCHFSRLLCIELLGNAAEPVRAIENIFVGLAILEAKGARITSLAMPLVGAGHQSLDPHLLMPTLLRAARRALEHSSYLQRILFVDKNPRTVHDLSVAMNEALGRVRVMLPKGQLVTNLRADILTTFDRIASIVPHSHQRLVAEARRIFSVEQPRSFEVGVLGRRVAEFISDDLLGKVKSSPDLLAKIDSLGDKGIAPWIRGYLHTLRVLGNESTHEKSVTGRIPQNVVEDDLPVALFCMQRVLAFWEEYRKNQGSVLKVSALP